MKKTLALTLMATSFVALQAMASDQQEDYPTTPTRLKQKFKDVALSDSPSFKTVGEAGTLHMTPYTKDQHKKRALLDDRSKRLQLAFSLQEEKILQDQLDEEAERLAQMSELAQENQRQIEELLLEIEEGKASILRLEQDKSSLAFELDASQERVQTVNNEKETLASSLQETKDELGETIRKLTAATEDFFALQENLDRKAEAYELAQEALEEKKEALRLAEEKGEQTKEELQVQSQLIKEKESELAEQKESYDAQKTTLSEEKRELQKVRLELKAVKESRERNVNILQGKVSQVNADFLKSDAERRSLQKLLDAKEKSILEIEELLKKKKLKISSKREEKPLETQKSIDDVEGDLF